MTDRPTQAMAASCLLAPWLDGPAQRLTVAHRSRLALSLADETGRVAFSVMFPGAVRLPYACAVAPVASTSSSISVGDGVLAWGDDHAPDAVAFRVARWWRPARPDPGRHQPLARHVDPAAVRLWEASWRDRIGGGPGLTPYADDVLCGALVALRAAGDPGAEALSSAVAGSDLEAVTTATSASLLRAACEGWCIDELAAYLQTLAGSGDTEPSRAALLAVGSSSGQGLLAGVASVLPGLVDEVAA